MSDMINLTIDGKSVQAKKGDTILDVARANNLYIPTMCYITKTTPISSCRLCVVEVEGTDGFVLSCQTPALDGINVTTNSSELYRHRQNIMKLYAVNHPLECGVCTKSGECDLQNKTLEFGITEQNFSAREHNRPLVNFSNFVSYDESLCILCEKCVSVCNEVVGDDSLEVLFGGYSSKIQRKGDSTCSDCGECMAVCPVGALGDRAFKYTTNAWELSKVPATCAHCSAGCSLNYEVKHTSAFENNSNKIYRVTNTYEYDSLCAAGRFGFDYTNKGSNNADDFAKTLEAFKEAKSIKFNSYITNEEAFILENLKEKHGYKLINEDARKYQEFMSAYSSITGQSLYNGDLDAIRDSDYAITIGSAVASDNPKVKMALNQASKRNKAEVIYMHPIEDDSIKNIVTSYIRYEVGTEEGVLAVLANLFVDKEKADNKTKSYLDELDFGYVSNESNISEDDVANLEKKALRKKSKVLIVGADAISHTNATSIAKLVATLQKYAEFKVVVIPTQTNTLGVSLICNLDKENKGKSIGYNVNADFVLSCDGSGDVNMPALNQQEGTITTIDKRVVPTNVAIEFDGFVLNDIANELGFDDKYTVDYTCQLPIEKGFKIENFDNLENFITSMNDDRGYGLESMSVETSEFDLDSIEDLPEFNGSVVYNCNPETMFDYASDRLTRFESSAILVGSSQFAMAAKIADGDSIEFMLDGTPVKRVFKIDSSIKGTIALNPTFDLRLSNDLLCSMYRYRQVKINKNGE
jgi:NADH-quinone oxidoreductase subunit G